MKNMTPVHVPITTNNLLEIGATQQTKASIFARGSGLLQDHAAMTSSKSHINLNNFPHGTPENLFHKKQLLNQSQP